MSDIDEMADFFDNDNFADEPTLEEENGGSVPTDDQVLNNLFDESEEPTKKKRVIQRPQPKLNEETLTGPKGIQALRNEFKNYKPDLTVDPYANLSHIMKKYEHWAHVMFPKMKFDDVISRCETLGDKRAVKVYMMKSRLDMPLTDEDFAAKEKDDGIIETEHNDGIITTRDESDEDNYYDPLQKDKSSPVKSHIPEHVRKMMAASKEAEKNASQNAESNDVDFDMGMIREAELLQFEEEQRRMEQEADEAMADFDF